MVPRCGRGRGRPGFPTPSHNFPATRGSSSYHCPGSSFRSKLIVQHSCNSSGVMRAPATSDYLLAVWYGADPSITPPPLASRRSKTRPAGEAPQSPFIASRPPPARRYEPVWSRFRLHWLRRWLPSASPFSPTCAGRGWPLTSYPLPLAAREIFTTTTTTGLNTNNVMPVPAVRWAMQLWEVTTAAAQNTNIFTCESEGRKYADGT